MGLADRFKERLESKNIFQEVQNSEKEESGFVTEPVEIRNNKVPENNCDTVDSLKFEDLETEIITKIRKTPYWEDYSKKRQENMITLYFDKKIQEEKYSNINYSLKDKLSFIKNILTLSNYR